MERSERGTTGSDNQRGHTNSKVRQTEGSDVRADEQGETDSWEGGITGRDGRAGRDDEQGGRKIKGKKTKTFAT